MLTYRMHKPQWAISNEGHHFYTRDFWTVRYDQGHRFCDLVEASPCRNYGKATYVPAKFFRPVLGLARWGHKTKNETPYLGEILAGELMDEKDIELLIWNAEIALAALETDFEWVNVSGQIRGAPETTN